MSVGGTVSANRKRVVRFSYARLCALIMQMLIRLEKTVKQMTGSLLAIRGLLFLIGLKLSSIKNGD
jgi:hypothetical protein